MSIFDEVKDVAESTIEEIVTTTKELASSAWAFIKVEAAEAWDMLVARVKETGLGTAIMNLISAADSTSTAGVEKFAGVMAAAQAAWTAFQDAGGLKGIITALKNALVYVVQALVEEFKAAS